MTAPADYRTFLARKGQLEGDHGFEPDDMPTWLYDFQADLVSWACRKGRGALFADCGMGKTPMQLAWAHQVNQRIGKPVLIVAPLAVSFQTQKEAAKFGVDAAVSRDGSVAAAITITNYDRLHLFDRAEWGGVVLDESSAIKSFDGERRRIVTDFARWMPYRLLATATAAPNDYIELGTSSEALGYLGHMDMLNRYFTNSQHTSRGVRSWGTDKWRFKGHAEVPFWRWVSSWARAMRWPSDLGYSDEGFQLPDLRVRQHIIDAREPAPDRLFDLPAVGLQEERAESSRTVQERCEAAALAVSDADVAVLWCQLNKEGDALERIVPNAVQVRGSDQPEDKEEKLRAFAEGEISRLVTKPSITGWGLNWQHCHRMSYFPSHSYEQWYQAVRRFWRFGQTSAVEVDVIATEGTSRMLENLQRKAEQADRMFQALTAHMRDAHHIERTVNHPHVVEVPSWVS